MHQLSCDSVINLKTITWIDILKSRSINYSFYGKFYGICLYDAFERHRIIVWFRSQGEATLMTRERFQVIIISKVEVLNYQSYFKFPKASQAFFFFMCFFFYYFFASYYILIVYHIYIYIYIYIYCSTTILRRLIVIIFFA